MSLQALLPVIESAGYAKVIVSLKRGAPNAQAAVAASSTGLSRALALDVADVMSLQNHFIIPPTTRQILPAATAAMSLAAGRGASGAGAAGRRRRGAAVKSPETAPRMRVFPHLGLALGFVDTAGAAALTADARVANVMKAPEPRLIRPVAVGPARSRRDITWGLERLGVQRMWAADYRGQGVRVGHLDTGADGEHPALKDAIKMFAEFDNVGEIVPNAKAHDSGEHGTHTAGTIAGRATEKGSFGVAPEAELACGMVIEGGQVIDRILAGLEWIISQKCRILSMSLGLQGMETAFQVVIDAVRAAGVLPVIAIGNEGADTSRSPGNYANVLSVGAIDQSDTVAGFSGSQRFNRQDAPLVPLLVAPGVGVLSCTPDGRYAEMDGSSMATPHIAGLAALLFSAKSAATIDEVEQAIIASCARPATIPEERGNHGVPDAALAFRALTGNDLPTALAAAATQVKRTGKRRTPAKASRPVKVAARSGRR